jgi:hypothetical protein
MQGNFLLLAAIIRLAKHNGGRDYNLTWLCSWEFAFRSLWRPWRYGKLFIYVQARK